MRGGCRPSSARSERLTVSLQLLFKALPSETSCSFAFVFFVIFFPSIFQFKSLSFFVVFYFPLLPFFLSSFCFFLSFSLSSLLVSFVYCIYLLSRSSVCPSYLSVPLHLSFLRLSSFTYSFPPLMSLVPSLC